MLTRASRLTTGREFSQTIRHGRRAGSRHLVVHLDDGDDRTDEPGEPARAGLVVSRAVGSAVTRNRVKRRLRHAVREHLHDLPDGIRVVVRALPPAAGASSAELDRDLRRCLERALVRARDRAPHRAGAPSGGRRS